MALAVVYAWYMTAWVANWLNPDRLPVRVLLVGLMFASLLMSVAIPDAFDGRAWLFVTGYLLLQAGRAASSARTGRYGPAGLNEERLTTAAPASLQRCRSAWDSLVLRTEASLRPFQARLARELPVRKRV
jgi:hypothetical protein